MNRPATLGITIILKGRSIVDEAWDVVDCFNHTNNLMATFSFQHFYTEVTSFQAPPSFLLLAVCRQSLGMRLTQKHNINYKGTVTLEL